MEDKQQASAYPQIIQWLNPPKSLKNINLAKLKTYLTNLPQLPPVKDKQELQLILQEIYLLNLPLSALKIIDANLDLKDDSSYESTFTEAVFALSADELDRAEQCFTKAHKLAFAEVAPLTNLGQTMLYKEEWNSAWSYCLQGLEREKNHTPLWRLAYTVLEKTAEDPSADLKKLFRKYNSWKGCSLYMHIEDTLPDSEKTELLNTFYLDGEESDDFLIEYTAILGVCKQFKEILKIVWKKTSLSTEEIHWKIAMHQIQAQFELNQVTDFNDSTKNLLKRQDLPQEIISQVSDMIESLKKEEHAYK
jgi:hypothetical protein